MSKVLVTAFEKDLLTYSKADLVVMAGYYGISIKQKKADLAREVAKKVVAENVDRGNMTNGQECGSRATDVQAELYSKLNELRAAQDRLAGQIEMGKAQADGNEFEQMIPQLFTECDTELQQLKNCVDSNVDAAKQKIEEKISLIDQFLKSKQTLLFEDAVVVDKPLVQPPAPIMSGLFKDAIVPGQQPATLPTATVLDETPDVTLEPRLFGTTEQPVIEQESQPLISGLFPIPDKDTAERVQVQAVIAGLAPLEEDDELLLKQMEDKWCENDSDCPSVGGQKVICVTKKSDGKTACVNEDCIIDI